MRRVWSRAVRAAALLALVAPTVAVHAQTGPVADIRGRPECDRRRYHDVDLTFGALFDSSAAAPLLIAFRRPPPDAYSATVGLAPDGQVRELVVVANNHAPAEREALAARLRSLVRPQGAAPTARTYMVVVAAGPDSMVALDSPDYTCLATLRNSAAVQRRFAQMITQLRKAGTLAAGASGRVVVNAVLSERGQLDSAWVAELSGAPAADSVAVVALRSGQFRPAVVGRRSVRFAIASAFQF